MFVSVNCATISPSLVASELSDHEKGAFRGAIQRRLGWGKLVDGGTICLGEIGEIPLETQISLLRVLEEREVECVGGNRPIRVDVHIIAATNRNLQAAIVAGTFRKDSAVLAQCVSDKTQTKVVSTQNESQEVVF